MKSIKDIDKKHIINTYNRYDLELVEGMGVNAYDIDNKEYIDLSAGIGVNQSRLLRNGLGSKRYSTAMQAQSRQQFVLFSARRFACQEPLRAHGI